MQMQVPKDIPTMQSRSRLVIYTRSSRLISAIQLFFRRVPKVFGPESLVIRANVIVATAIVASRADRCRLSSIEIFFLPGVPSVHVVALFRWQTEARGMKSAAILASSSALKSRRGRPIGHCHESSRKLHIMSRWRTMNRSCRKLTIVSPVELVSFEYTCLLLAHREIINRAGFVVSERTSVRFSEYSCETTHTYIHTHTHTHTRAR